MATAATVHADTCGRRPGRAARVPLPELLVLPLLALGVALASLPRGKVMGWGEIPHEYSMYAFVARAFGRATCPSGTPTLSRYAHYTDVAQGYDPDRPVRAAGPHGVSIRGSARSEYLFRAVVIPAGSHDVRFVYHDRMLVLGAILASLTAACGLAVWVLSERRRAP